MKTINLKYYDNDKKLNEQKKLLYKVLVSSAINDTKLLISVDPNFLLSSSFLNSNVGRFLDDYDLELFRKNVKFKGTKSQFKLLSNYIKIYKEVYLDLV